MSTIGPLLLLHFDGVNGQGTTVDSSFYAWPVVTTSTFSLSTTNPKFGTAELSLPAISWFSNPAPAYIAYAYNSPLDIFKLPGGWTIECWILAGPYNGSIATIHVNYGGSYNTGYNPGTGLFIESATQPDGSIDVSLVNNGAFTGASSVSGNISSAGAGLWHHVAAVNDGTQTKLYLDGVSQGSPSVNWNAAQYVQPPMIHGPNVVIGAFGGYTGAVQSGLMDELRVLPCPYYLANFTPPIAPFSNAVGCAGSNTGNTGKGDFTDPFAWQDSKGNLPPLNFVSNSGGSNF